MTTRKIKSGMQWKVYRDVHVDDLQKTLDDIGASKWNVFAIVGPLGGLCIITNRMLVL